MRRALGRLSGFALSSAVTGVSSIATVPILVLALGAAQWGAVAVGQSIGIIGSIFLGLGWNVSGAATIASRPDGASRYLRESIVTRTVLILPIGIAVALIGWFVGRGSLLAAATAVAFAVTGFSSNWFFIGLARPTALLLRETLPRAVTAIAGALLVLAGFDPLLYPAAVFAGCLLAVGLTVRSVPRDPQGTRPLAAVVASTLREQSTAAITGVVSSTYINLPTVAVAIFAPAQTPVIALADRLFKFANSALAPISQTLLGWIPHPDLPTRLVRVRSGSRIAAVVAVVAAIGFAVVCVFAGQLLTAGRIAVGWPVALAFAFTLAFTTLSQTVGLACLTSLGAIRNVAISAVVGALIGGALLLPATRLAGAEGAAASESVAEGLVLGYQLLVLRRILRRHSAADAGLPPTPPIGGRIPEV